MVHIASNTHWSFSVFLASSFHLLHNNFFIIMQRILCCTLISFCLFSNEYTRVGDIAWWREPDLHKWCSRLMFNSKIATAIIINTYNLLILCPFLKKSSSSLEIRQRLPSHSMKGLRRGENVSWYSLSKRNPWMTTPASMSLILCRCKHSYGQSRKAQHGFAPATF